MDKPGVSAREFDIILWGASGYMGHIIAEHLFQTYGVNQALRWAIAGRNGKKLEAVRSGLGDGAEQIPIIGAESHDRSSLNEMVRRTRVICSSVGPYQLYGEELVAACIDNGTDYCDLTGEYTWIRQMIDRYEEKARANGVRIVNSCGFDSLPSDLGTLFIENEMKKRYGVYSADVKMRVKHGFNADKPSGGTMASIISNFELVSADKQLMKQVYDPNSLLPRDDSKGAGDKDIKFPRYEKEISSWVAPYIMAAGNTKIVRRGNALLDRRYGRDFRYGEGLCTGPGITGWWHAIVATTSLYMFMLLFMIGFTRKQLQRKFPRPGEGMTREERESLSYHLVFTAFHPEDQKKIVQTEIQGKRDMGYGSSARMIGEAAVCLALDKTAQAKAGGFWTPASCMGERLIERLEQNAEIKFSVVPGSA